MKTKILLFMAAFAMNFALSAATITVTNDEASGEGSLLWAYTTAVAEDIINFDFDGSEITLPDAVAMKSITINGLNAHNNQKVILKQATGKSYFTLASGITGTFKNLIFNGTDIAGNTAINAVNGSTLIVEYCEFVNINAQANNGGAMRVQGEADITNSLFEGNKTSGGYGGGAICIYHDADVRIDKCTFVNNSSLSTAGNPNRSGGGAIVVRGTATAAVPTKLAVSNSTFANNTSTNFGSAVLSSVQSGTNFIVNVDIINCTITGNTSDTTNGAVETHANSQGTLNLNLINSIVTYNINSSGYSDVLENKESANATYTTELYNTIYGVSSVTPDAGRNCIVVTAPETANIFKTLETFATDKKRPVLTDSAGQKYAEIPQNSIANGAGIATLSGFTIPTVDQTGYDRPATPSIGAVEYHVSVGLTDAANNELKMMTKDKAISFTGLSGINQVSVYGLTGNLLHRSLVSNEQAINLNHLSDNLVIVRIAGESFKVLLK
ncbi:MAG: hypothetical protein M0Q54_08165 [Pigmentiphaga sp.]|nr:hypothetical protein [Pigmentiphaga sp.]